MQSVRCAKRIVRDISPCDASPGGQIAGVAVFNARKPRLKRDV
jgi:hypothetical protein